MIRKLGTLALGIALGFAAPASADESRPCRVVADSTLQAPRFAAGNVLDGDTTDAESRWASSRGPEPHWVVLTPTGIGVPSTVDISISCRGISLPSVTVALTVSDSGPMPRLLKTPRLAPRTRSAFIRRIDEAAGLKCDTLCSESTVRSPLPMLRMMQSVSRRALLSSFLALSRLSS